MNNHLAGSGMRQGGMSSNINNVGRVAVAAGSFSGGDDLRSSVLRAFSEYAIDGAAHDIGHSVDAVLSKLQKSGKNVNMRQLREVIEDLTSNAELYSTEDENHYKPTSEM